jgi:2-(1,2-epoxy-1,2-dihydrophenyl)acetyl-CoA isomerase
VTELVKLTCSRGTATVTLNRPEKRNALSLAMRDQLVAALDECVGDGACHAIVLTGEGHAFCSGADLRETTGGQKPSLEDRKHRLLLLQKVVRRIIMSPKPVIAAVNGAAFGAGLSLVTACDSVVASEKAEFCAIFSRVGLLPDAGILWTLPRRVGSARASRMLLTGERLTSAAALAIGLVDEIATEDRLLDAAYVLAGAYRYSAPLAISSIKRTLANEPTSLDAVFAYEAEVQHTLSDSQDSDEAKAAFFEKRTPNFRGT